MLPDSHAPFCPRPEDLGASLQAAYVHVHRYFRHWLNDVPGGERLAHDLAGEALVRIGRSDQAAEQPGPRLIAFWLATAHQVAQELANAAE